MVICDPRFESQLAIASESRNVSTKPSLANVFLQDVCGINPLMLHVEPGLPKPKYRNIRTKTYTKSPDFCIFLNFFYISVVEVMSERILRRIWVFRRVLI